MNLTDIQEEQARASETWFPESDNLFHHVIALTGEWGEFCNFVKKVDRGSLQLTPETRAELGNELADVLIYLVDVARHVGIDLEEFYKIKHAFNVNRWGPINNASSPDIARIRTQVQQRQHDAYGAGAFVPEADIS